MPTYGRQTALAIFKPNTSTGDGRFGGRVDLGVERGVAFVPYEAALEHNMQTIWPWHEALGSARENTASQAKDATVMWIWGLLAIVIIALVWRLFNQPRGAQTQPPESPGTQKSAVATLEDRYARGEIDREEFEQKRQQLRR